MVRRARREAARSDTRSRTVPGAASVTVAAQARRSRFPVPDTVPVPALDRLWIGPGADLGGLRGGPGDGGRAGAPAPSHPGSATHRVGRRVVEDRPYGGVSGSQQRALGAQLGHQQLR
ncbi:hypothetical protein GCM10009863_33280 [Streptomyces axinellae]|uniref:Uncharacterized protein n=1 Tax=Streptomyces axinellae TaxID=552788 RepID=A0ABP6CK54_9ACTN